MITRFHLAPCTSSRGYIAHARDGDFSDKDLLVYTSDSCYSSDQQPNPVCSSISSVVLYWYIECCLPILVSNSLFSKHNLLCLRAMRFLRIVFRNTHVT